MAFNSSADDKLTLESVRKSLIRQEDTIIFSLIERAKYPFTPKLYDPNLLEIPGFAGSFFEYFVRETETVQSKVGRYESVEEHPFFPDSIWGPVLPLPKSPSVLHPAGDCINLNMLGFLT